MKKTIVTTLVALTIFNTAVYAGGFTLAPDGSYVAGSSASLAPDGSYVGSD